MGIKVFHEGNGAAAIDKILRVLKGPDQVQVGFPSGTGTDIVDRAINNEFGTAGGASGGGWGGPIPERPFFRNAMGENKGKYRNLTAGLARKILTSEGKFTKREALKQLGVEAQGDIQDNITDLRSPVNAQVTIDRKGSSNPLIDSGEMRSKVTFRVED